MTGKLLSRDSINVVLVYAMGVFLVLAVFGQAVSMIWGQQTFGTDVADVAEASAWLYAAAFVSMFVFALSEHKSPDDTRRHG
jgi:amino acid permease